jgi:RNA polymerase sigma-70 factor (ECF subfamily)
VKSVNASAAAQTVSLEAEPLEFEQVYRDCFPSIWRTLARLGVPSGQLDDVAQEVFLLMHRKLKELRDPTRLRAWATSFAIRAASDVRRANRRRGVTEEVPEGLRAPDQTDAQLERRQQLEVLQGVLGQLSDENREVFVLIELEELSGPEVAEALGLSVNTVYSRLRLARAAFNDVIARLPEAR